MWELVEKYIARSVAVLELDLCNVFLAVYMYLHLWLGEASPGLTKMSGVQNLASTEELNQNVTKAETPTVSIV